MTTSWNARLSAFVPSASQPDDNLPVRPVELGRSEFPSQRKGVILNEVRQRGMHEAIANANRADVAAPRSLRTTAAGATLA